MAETGEITTIMLTDEELSLQGTAPHQTFGRGVNQALIGKPFSPGT